MTTEDGKKMTHEEKMEWLRIYDPITYSELTSDPTNANSNDGGCLTVILLFVVAVLGFLVISAFLI